MSKANRSEQELTYEQAYAELESIVAELESGEHTLEEAIVKYERGQVLAKYCANLLDKAELKVGQLAGDQIVDFDS